MCAPKMDWPYHALLSLLRLELAGYIVRHFAALLLLNISPSLLLLES